MTLKLGDQNSGERWFFNLEFCIRTVEYVHVYKNISRHPESQRIYFQCIFLRKLQEDVFYQNKELNQERERHGIKKKIQSNLEERQRISSAGTAVCRRFRKKQPMWVRSRGWRLQEGCLQEKNAAFAPLT